MSLPLALLLHYPPVYDSVYVNAPFFIFQFMLIIIISGAQLLQGRMKYLQLVLLIFSLFSSIAVSERNNFFRPDWTGTVFIKEASQFIRDGDVVKTSGDTFTFLPEKVFWALKLISPPFLSEHASGICSIYLGYGLMEEGYEFLHSIFNRYRNNDEIIHYYYVFCMDTGRKNEGLSGLSKGIIRTGFSSPELLNDAGIFHAEMGNSGAAMHFFTRSNTIESLKNILILLQLANL